MAAISPEKPKMLSSPELSAHVELDCDCRRQAGIEDGELEDDANEANDANRSEVMQPASCEDFLRG